MVMKRNEHVNIRKVAKLAGVSTATVSRSINQPQMVSPETRARVIDAINKTGYIAKKTPRDKKHHSSLLLFIFDEADYRFYEEMFYGFDAILGEQDAAVLYCPISPDDNRADAQLFSLLNNDIAGIIFALRDFHFDFVTQCRKRHIPIVFARKYSYSESAYPRCYTDFEVGSYRMTKYLLSLNHRKINLMVEKASLQFVESFCAGWRRAYFENGIDFSDDWIVHTINDMEGGYRKALEIFQTGEKPDAFFCASNEMAFGILRAARHSGIAVPKELSITGFTDSPIAKLAEPPLTTLEQPIRQLGAVLIRTLLDLIHSKSYAQFPHQEIVLQPHLCVRGSSGEHKNTT